MRDEIPVDSTHAEYEPQAASGAPSQLTAITLAVVCAAVCYLMLPAATFRTHALLALDGGSAALRATLIRVAAESVVSKPVIDRAAASLLATDGKALAPDFVDRLGVAAGTKDATSRQARLADVIAFITRADPGTLPGTLDIAVAGPVAEQGARIADALADAFVTQQDDAATQARLRRDEHAATRVDVAKAAALASRQRLVALGGASLDPIQARNAAAAQTLASETRLASIRAIMASSSPPLSERKDLPPVLALPQADYLDMKAQLAKQSETLGERHTTIIALQEGVKRAAATLSAEWNRLKRMAESDVVAAREREAALRKTDAPADTKRRDTLDEARRAVVATDDALALAQKQQDVMADEPTFRLIAKAPVPKLPTGLSVVARLTLSVLAGVVGFGLFRGLHALSARRGTRVGPIASSARDPVAFDAMSPATTSAPPQPTKSSRKIPIPARKAMRFFEDEAFQPARLRSEIMSPPRPRAERSSPRVPSPVLDDHDERDLVDATRSVLDTVASRGLICPTIMVAANEGDVATTPVALALGRAVTERQWRVLLIEADRFTPVLASNADLDAAPVLVDLYGTLRIGLAADGDSAMVLAPVLEGASRLASDLARSSAATVIDDLASAFDVIVIDGGVAADAVEAGWTADAFVRVGARASRHDDDVFCATFEVSSALRLATILPSGIADPVVVAPSILVPRSMPPRAAPLRARSPTAPASASAPRRKIATR